MNQAGGWPTTRVTLIAQIQNAADADAWREFVDLYAPVVHNYCRRRGLQFADAQNIAQEVFSHVSRAIGTFEFDSARGRFRNWLGLITHQQMLKYGARQARPGRGVGEGRGEAILETFDGEAAAIWTETVNAHIYARAVERVRQDTDAEVWQAFHRVWENEERPGDVAREMGKAPQWVYQCKHRVIRRLKQEIERMADDTPVLNRT